MTTKKIIGYAMLGSVGLLLLAMFVAVHGIWQTMVATIIVGVVVLLLVVGFTLIERP